MINRFIIISIVWTLSGCQWLWPEADLCPAGTAAEFEGTGKFVCDNSGELDLNLPTQSGSGSLNVKCEESGDRKYICKPLAGWEPATTCGQYGVAEINRTAIKCVAPPSCAFGSNLVTEPVCPEGVTCTEGFGATRRAYCKPIGECKYGMESMTPTEVKCLPAPKPEISMLDLKNKIDGSLQNCWQDQAQACATASVQVTEFCNRTKNGEPFPTQNLSPAYCTELPGYLYDLSESLKTISTNCLTAKKLEECEGEPNHQTRSHCLSLAASCFDKGLQIRGVKYQAQEICGIYTITFPSTN